MFLVIALLGGAFSAPAAFAAGEAEIVLQKQFAAMTPMFMSGHEGDPEWIEGYSFEGTILMEGREIGAVSGTAELLAPPMIFMPYGHVFMQVLNDIQGMGSYEVTAQGTVLNSSTTAIAGDTVVAWSGAISNGTGAFANAYGLAAGTFVGNVFTGTGSATEVMRIRIGY
jgi:hypothetical protein